MTLGWTSILALTGPLGLDWGVYLALAFVFAIVLAIWVFRDASRRGMNAAQWALIVFLTALVGLGLYLILRRSRPAAAG